MEAISDTEYFNKLQEWKDRGYRPHLAVDGEGKWAIAIEGGAGYAGDPGNIRGRPSLLYTSESYTTPQAAIRAAMGVIR